MRVLWAVLLLFPLTLAYPTSNVYGYGWSHYCGIYKIVTVDEPNLAEEAEHRGELVLEGAPEVLKKLGLAVASKDPEGVAAATAALTSLKQAFSAEQSKGTLSISSAYHRYIEVTQNFIAKQTERIKKTGRFSKEALVKINPKFLAIAVANGIFYNNVVKVIIPDHFPYSIITGGMDPVFNGVSLALVGLATMDFIGFIKSSAVGQKEGDAELAATDFAVKQIATLYDNIAMYPDTQNTGKDIENGAILAAQSAVAALITTRAPTPTRVEFLAEELKLWQQNRRSVPLTNPKVGTVFRRLFRPEVENSLTFSASGAPVPSMQAFADDLIIWVNAIDHVNYNSQPTLRKNYHDTIEAITGLKPNLEEALQRRQRHGDRPLTAL